MKKSEFIESSNVVSRLFYSNQSSIDIPSLARLWLNVDGYFPITNSEYTITESQNLYDPKKIDYDNWHGEFTFNGILKINNVWTGFALGYKIFNNNNIESKEIKKNKFISETGIESNGFQSITEKSIYTGEFEEFITNQIKAEMTFLFYNASFGVSAGIDKNFGNNDNINWKLGLPLNIHSKEMHEIGLEIQWREFNGNHYLGLSVGKMIGKFVN